MKVIRKPGPGKIEIENAIKNLKGTVGKVGWFPSAQYPDGTPVAYVATIQEFGSPSNNIPARPTMRPTIVEKRSEWMSSMQKGAKKVLKGAWSSVELMNKIGLVASGDFKEAITNLWSPQLRESTIKARERNKVKKKKRNKGKSAGITKPLIDTGLMLSTLTNIVEKNNDSRK